MKYNTILQIDDDLDDCEFFQEALQRVCNTANYIAVHDPVEALHKLTSSNLIPDLILLDINMPKMDGYTLLNLLRKNDSTRELPVILFSTSSHYEIKKINNLNVLEYITKPYSFEDLKKLIKRLMVI